MGSVVNFPVPSSPKQSIPLGCICAYTWSFMPSYTGLLRNGPLPSCPADHESS